MLGQKYSLDSEIQTFKPAKIVNFSSSLVQACFRLKIFLREKRSITYFLLCNKLTQNLVTSNNHHYLSIVYGSVAWVRFRDLALSRFSIALVHGSAVSWESATSLIYLVFGWLLAGALWSIFLILQPAGSFTGWWSQDFQDQEGRASLPCTDALTIFQTWVNQVNQSILTQGVETEIPPLDERMCNTTFQEGGYVAYFTIYYKEFELLFNICASQVLSFSLATSHSQPRCTQLGGFWLSIVPGSGTWLKLTLVWGTVILSSVNLFTRDLSLILDFGQRNLSSW